jgi:hypothetical protein
MVVETSGVGGHEGFSEVMGRGSLCLKIIQQVGKKQIRSIKELQLKLQGWGSWRFFGSNGKGLIVFVICNVIHQGNPYRSVC